MEEIINKEDEKERELGRKAISDFDKRGMAACMRDTKISLRLIIDCLEGRTTIEEYVYNRDFSVFAGKMAKHWGNASEDKSDLWAV